MTAELKEARAEIKKLNEELEQKVEERTRELIKINEALRSEIAERKLAEEAVKQAEDRIRLVIDTIPMMAWSLRPDGVLNFVNQRWLDYTGVSFQDAIREPNGIVHPEDVSRAVEKWLKDMAAAESSEDELRLRRADGEYRWFLIRTVPLFDEQGDILEWYGVSIDIEDRKQAEEALRKSEKLFAAFMDQLPGFAWMKNIEGRYVYVNKKESELDAYRAGAIGRTDAELWPAEIASAYRANDRQVIVTRKAVQTVEPCLADGKQCYMLVSKFPIFDQDGSVVMVAGAGVDITDRIQAEEALSESEAKFRLLLASNIVGVVFWTLQGDLLDANDLFLNMVGYTREDLRQGNLSWKKLTPPEYAQVDEKAIGELIATGTCAPFEKEYIRKDGSRVSVLIGSALLEPRKDAGSSFVMDITERKEAEERLRQSEEKFRALFGIAPVGISVLDRQRNVVDANSALEQILRLSKEELLNGSYRGRTYLNADGTSRPPNEMASARAITENRPLHDVETGIVTENGEIIWTQVSVAPLALPNAGAVVITQDITARKRAEQALRESEERFRELAENIDAFFWLTDLQHKDILYISPAYESIWGRTRASLLASPRSWREALHPEERERILALLSDGHPRGTPGLTFRIVRPDGSVRWIHSREFPVKDADGEVVRVAGIVEDITERKRVELALDERLRFETLLTELSAAFANLPTARVDQEIDKWLQNLVEFLDLDRAIFDQVGEDGMTLSRSHSYTARGIDTLPLDVANDQTPWITEQLLRGNTVKWSRIPDDIPAHASKEKKFAVRIRAKSVLSIPVCIGGSVICAVSFTSMRNYRDWSDDMVARLRLVGEIFANAIARKRAAKELEEANHQLRSLSRRLFKVQEEERRHLARELHDEIGQALTAAKLNLQSVTGNGDSATLARLQETTAILDRLLGQVRQISLDLRPSMLDDLGLVPAVRSLLHEQGRRASVAVSFSAENMPENLDPEIRTTCFRIAQEGITNAVRHADATQIDVDLRCEKKKLRLLIRDNGIGFDVESVRAQIAGLGLIGMGERAALVGGQTNIISSPNKGTTLEVFLPLMSRPDGQGRHSRE